MKHTSIYRRRAPRSGQFVEAAGNAPVPTDELERLRSFARSVDVMRRDLVERGPATDEWREWGRLCTFPHGVYGAYWIELLAQTAASADRVARLMNDNRARDFHRAVKRALSAWDGVEDTDQNAQDAAYAEFISALNDAGEAADDMGLLP